LTTACWTPVDQSRLILSMPVCAPDFQSVPPSPLAVVVAAAAVHPAGQIAANFFLLTPSYPRAVICRGYFFVISLSPVSCALFLDR